MKNMIKRNPRVFGFILLLGIVCGSYLAFMMIGNLIFMATPLDPKSIERPLLYQFVIYPIGGLFVSGILVLLCTLTAMIGYLIKALFDGTCSSINRLGQWLVTKTSNSIQEG